MTTGPVRGHVIGMALFMLVGMVLQTLYSLVDMYWAGKLGKEAVAAVAMASNLMFVVLAISQVLGVGTVALVSQAAGRKDNAQVQFLFNQAQSLSIVAGLLFLVVGFIAKPLYIAALGSDAQTVQLMHDFLIWFIPGQALLFLTVGLGSALRGIGNMKPGMLAQSGSVLLNMLLAPFLIFGWVTGKPLGVAGAGLATFIATLASSLGLLVYLSRDSTFLRVNFAQWRPDWAVWKRMTLIGLPAGMEFLIVMTILGANYIIIKSFGAQAQAGLGIGMRLMQAGFMPAIALSFAVAAVAGQNYGARRYDRVRETFTDTAKIATAYMIAFAILCHFGVASMIRAFSDDAYVQQVGTEYLKTISLIFIGSGLTFVSGGILQGMGNTLPSLLASASRLPTFIIPAAWLSHQPGFTLQHVWNTTFVSIGIQTALNLWLLRREFRRKLAPEPSVST